MRAILNQASAQDPATCDRLSLSEREVTEGLAFYNAAQNVEPPSASSGSLPSGSLSSTSTSPSASSVSTQNDLMITTQTDYVVFVAGSEEFVYEFRNNARWMTTRTLTDVANRWFQDHPNVVERTVRGREVIQSMTPISSRNTSPPAMRQVLASAPQVARQTPAPQTFDPSENVSKIEDSDDDSDDGDESSKIDETVSTLATTPSVTAQPSRRRLSPPFNRTFAAKVNELSEKFPYFHPLELYEAYVVFSNRLYTTSSTFQHLHDVDFTTLTTLLSNSRPRITITRIESTIVFKDNRFLGFDGIEEVFPASRFKSIDMMTRGTSSCVYANVHHAINAHSVNGRLSYRRDYCRFIEDISEETSLASHVMFWDQPRGASILEMWQC